MKNTTKLLPAIAVIFFFPFRSFAQNTNPWPSTGSVGIGTTAPSSPLTILNAASAGLGPSGNAMTSTVNSTSSGFLQGVAFYTNQNAANTSGSGVWGTSTFVVTGHPSGTNVVLATPSVNIMEHAAAGTLTEGRGVQGEILMGQTAGNITTASCFYATTAIINGTTSSGTITTGYGYYMSPFTSNFVNKYGFYINDATANNYLAGTMSIGTTSTQGYKLAVDGSAIFTQAVVKLFANWPDYVFQPSYQLPSLDSLKTYISVNSHLPGIPSGEEIKDKGQDLGATQTLLLKKIEELTLYVIQQNDRLAAQQKEIDQLTQRLGKRSGRGK